MRLFRAVLALSLVAVAACGSDKSTAPAPVATSIELVAPVTTASQVGTTLTAAPTFTVKDQFGHVLSGVPVTVAVTAGGGAIANAPTTSSSAAASLGTWTLGRTAGVNTLTVTVANLTPASISVTASAGAAAKITPISTQTLTGVVGQAVTAPPSARVTDAFDNPVPGATVNVSATNGGQVGGTLTSDASGVVTLSSWTLGTVKGVNVVTLTVGAASTTFTATAVPDVAAGVRVASGNAQSALAGTALPLPVKLSAVDRFGNAVDTPPNQIVTFSVATGGGALSSTTAGPGADGVITAPTWTLGRSAVPQQLRATFGTFSLLIDASVQTSYNIEVRFFGSTAMSDAQRALFTTAAARIRGAVVGLLTTIDLTGAEPDADCGATGVAPLTGGTTNGLIIYASIDTIDGSGKILARGGPCYVRTGANSATIIGVMSFDKDDINSLGTGQVLQDVITHEMLHVVGVGSLWNYKSLLSGYNTTDVAYLGTNGIQGCQTIGGSTSCASTVPVEGTGGAGTMNSHWRETTFRSELMTGYAENGPMPLSVMTIRSMADLGYTVNAASADPYSIFIGSLRASGSAGSPLPANWEGPTPFQPITLAVARQRAAARAALRSR
jgi:hypothetical protein